jgi:hypothetical protein
MITRLTVLALFVVIPALAQDEPAEQFTFVGPFLGLNIAMNTADYHVSGPTRALTPGSIVGVAADFPLGSTTGILVKLGYYTLAFHDENKNLDLAIANSNDVVLPSKLTTEGSFSYLAVSPMFRVGNFIIGFQFGLPVSSKITNSIATPSAFQIDPRFREDISPASSERNILVEGRIGGDFPIYENAEGGLHLEFSGGYTFTQILSKAENALPKLDDNFRLPDLMLSLSYRFRL